MHPQDLSSLSDEQLLNLCKKSSEEQVAKCVEILINRHYRRLYNYLYRMLPDSEAVEDIIQEAFFRIFKNAYRYKRTAKFTTWMFKIATNLALNELRRRRTHQSTPLDAQLDDEGARFLESLLSNEEAPIERLSKEELQNIIDEILEALPPDFRAVLLLCDMENMSYQQVAETLGLKHGTVGSRLCRARQLFAFYFTHRYKSLLR